MLVDLGRNDVGRVAEFGSVRLTAFMTIERYSHVMHLVSEVRGRLRPELDAVAALAACFPAGTVSGAPKVRAMQIIDELEPVRRGPYAGRGRLRRLGRPHARHRHRDPHLRHPRAAAPGSRPAPASSPTPIPPASGGRRRRRRGRCCWRWRWQRARPREAAKGPAAGHATSFAPSDPTCPSARAIFSPCPLPPRQRHRRPELRAPAGRSLVVGRGVATRHRDLRSHHLPPPRRADRRRRRRSR